MAQPINSFDIFDTLIARRGCDPHSVLRLLEVRAGIPGLAEARREADRAFGMRGQAYELRDIWRHAGSILALSDDDTERMMQMELRLEHDAVIPIAENLALVRDGDVLVSDTYLAAETVLSLLRRAGFDRRVGLVVTNDGKWRGWIWPRLLEQVAIRQHLGDNPHADGQTAAAAGVRAVIYTGSRRSPVESFLAQEGWEALANLVREVRLACPFSARTRANATYGD